MANATFHQVSYTVPGTSRRVYVRYLLCNMYDVNVRGINTSVKDSNFYGINGTYFAPGTSKIIGIALNRGSMVKQYGTMNRDPQQMGTSEPRACGTFFVLNSNLSGTSTICGTDQISIYENHVYNGYALKSSETTFAIGGSSLFPAETSLTQATFNLRMSAEDAGSPSGYHARTAIVYLGGSPHTDLNLALVTVQGPIDQSISTDTHFISHDEDGITLWELRTLINTLFGTSQSIVHAIALDGGGSTQIAYKRVDGTKIAYQVCDSDGGTNRNVLSMLSVPM